MSQPSNGAIFPILEDAEQLYNDVLQINMNSNENQRAKAMNRSNSFSSFNASKIKSPLRPLTSYNIFFQLQRERILCNDEFSTEKFTEQDIINVIQERYNNWAGIVSHDNRKHHNKNSKQIGFGELATKIAAKWKETDAETKALMKLYAKKERDKYVQVKREAEAAMKLSASLEKDVASITLRQTSSDGDLCRVINQVPFPSLACNRTVFHSIDSPAISNKPETLSNNGNMFNFDEDDWNNDFQDGNQQPNMDEMKQLLENSKRASSSFVAKDTDLILHKETYPIPDIGSEFYARNKFWQNQVRKNLAYTEAQLKYHHHLRQVQITYWQLQSMNAMQNNLLLASQLQEDEDCYLPLDDDCEDIDTSDDIFVEPAESLNTMDENYSSSLPVQDDEFLQMKPSPNDFMNSYNDLNQNCFDRDDDDDNDYDLSLL